LPAKPILPEAILDKKSYLAGRFLITKYACHQQMFGLTSQDLPDISTLEGSKPLLQRLKILEESYPDEQNWYVVYIRTRDSLTISLFQLISEARLWNNLV
jgi:hypothetical protein